MTIPHERRFSPEPYGSNRTPGPGSYNSENYNKAFNCTVTEFGLPHIPLGGIGAYTPGPADYLNSKGMNRISVPFPRAIRIGNVKAKSPGPAAYAPHLHLDNLGGVRGFKATIGNTRKDFDFTRGTHSYIYIYIYIVYRYYAEFYV